MMESLRKHPGLWIFVAALIATAAIYSQGFSGGWLFDDYPNIVDNPGIQIHDASVSSLARAAMSLPSSRFKRPLAAESFAFNYLAGGLNPYGWKVTNVVIHLINGLLVFLLARLLLPLAWPVIRRAGTARHGQPDGGGQCPPCVNGISAAWPPEVMRRIGIIAALIAGGWMLLPINLTAVLYVVQRMASMANVFVLLGLIGYVVGRKRMLDATRSRGWAFVLCVASLVVCMAIGFTAKETAVMLMPFAFLVEWLLFGFRTRPDARHKRDWLIIGLFVVVLLVPLIIGVMYLLPHALSPGTWARRDFDLRTRLLSEARIVIDYIGWTLVPTLGELSFYHDGYPVSHSLFAPWTTLPCIIAIAALIALAIWLRKRAPLASLGVLLFFASNVLTATIIPLELVFEHRNYFASFGLLLAVVPVLSTFARRAPVVGAGHARDQDSPAAGSTHDRSRAWPAPATKGLPLALPRYVLLAGLIALWAAETGITAHAWGNPLLLAQTLAVRAPNSPRAQYELGRTYIVYSHYKPDSPFTQAAYAPLERAAALPHSSILPEQALIFMNARMHKPIKDAWWTSLIDKLKQHDPTVQDISSLAALTQCAREGGCKLSKPRMIEAFLAALSHQPPEARLLAIYGDYAWNVLDDHPLGSRMLADAVKRDPNEPAYHITYTRMLVVQGRFDAAHKQIHALEQLNIGGRLNGSIAGLRALVATASSR